MARPREPEPLEGPIRFGPYTLAHRIGAGGMGEVFLAREEGLGRACVVKKVLDRLHAHTGFVGRFRDEARVVVHLRHPNIARVHAMGEIDGQLYLAMEYVQGKTLSRLAYRLRQRKQLMGLGLILYIGQKLCEGLAYAHDAKDEHGAPLHLVHRDLSPANICISYAGEVKIIDFGAAQSTLKEQQTAPRVVIGNLAYMAPEQARKKLVDRRADVYSAAVVLWELFAGVALSQKGDPLERWRRAAYPKWQPPGNHRAGVPASVDALLMRALATEPSERIPDAATFGAELARLKARLAPRVGEADLARLMAETFAEEKAVEERLLAELLRDGVRTTTSEQVSATFAPPTALAFEHRGLAAPEDYVPAEHEEAPVALAASEGPRVARHRPPTQEARLGFGVDITQPLDAGMVEAAASSLVRAIEGDEPEADAPAAPVRDMQASSVEADKADRRPRWLGAALFFGAGAVGFGLMWLLLRG